MKLIKKTKNFNLLASPALSLLTNCRTLKTYIKPTTSFQNQIIFTLSNPMFSNPSLRKGPILKSLNLNDFKSPLFNWQHFNKDTVLRCVTSAFFSTNEKFTNLAPAITRFEILSQLENLAEFKGIKGTKNILLVLVTDMVTPIPFLNKPLSENPDSEISFPISLYKANKDPSTNVYVMEVEYFSFFENICMDLFIANRNYLPRLTFFHVINKSWGEIVYNFRKAGVLIGGGVENKRHMLSKPQLALSQYLNLFTGPFSGLDIEESFSTVKSLEQQGKLVRLDNSKKKKIVDPVSFFYTVRSNLYLVSTINNGRAPFYIDFSEFSSKEKEVWQEVTGLEANPDKIFYINGSYIRNPNIKEGGFQIVWGDALSDISGAQKDPNFEKLGFIFNEETLTTLSNNPMYSRSTSDVFTYSKETGLNITDVFLRGNKRISPYKDFLNYEKYRALKPFNKVNSLIQEGKQNMFWTLNKKIGKRTYSNDVFNKGDFLTLTLEDKSEMILNKEFEEIEEIEEIEETEKMEQNKKNKTLLPNIYKLAERFRFEWESFEYCQDHRVFYIYKDHLWKSYKEDYIEKIFFNWLKLKYPQAYYNFNIKKLAEISLILKNDRSFNSSPLTVNRKILEIEKNNTVNFELPLDDTTFSMKRNKEIVKRTKGVVIPFKNGVLVMKKDFNFNTIVNIANTNTSTNTLIAFKEQEQELESKEEYYTPKIEKNSELSQIFKNSSNDLELNKKVFNTEILALHTKRFNFYPHSKDNFLTHKMEVSYDPNAEIKGTLMETYLISIANNNNLNLSILRACLYCIILNITDTFLREKTGEYLKPFPDASKGYRKRKSLNSLRSLFWKGGSARSLSSFTKQSKYEKDLNKEPVLPNIYKLADVFRKQLGYLEYCHDQHLFYIYTDNIWKNFKEEVIENMFFNWLKLKYPHSYHKFNIKRLEDICTILKNDKTSLEKTINVTTTTSFTKRENENRSLNNKEEDFSFLFETSAFSMVAKKERVNQEKGILIPFKNGVLVKKSEHFLDSSVLTLKSSESESLESLESSESESLESSKTTQEDNLTIYQLLADSTSYSAPAEPLSSIKPESLKVEAETNNSLTWKESEPEPESEPESEPEHYPVSKISSSPSLKQKFYKLNKTDCSEEFKNFNLSKFELIPHSESNYLTHKMELEYDVTATIKDTLMEKFLLSIAKNKRSNLAVLRAILYCTLLNIIDFQVALYLLGPGGTGKTTFINLILYIIGPDAAHSTSLKALKGRLGLTALENKILLVINDMSYYKGEEPQILKEIITGDKMEREVKYKDPMSFLPRLWVVLASNTLWDIKNQTSGLNRRMIYFPFDNVKNSRIPNLLRLDKQDKVNEISLKPYIPGFVNWILSCPVDYLDLLKEGGDNLTAALNPDSLKLNPLKTWVEEHLTPSVEGIEPVGNKTTQVDTLFGNYSSWATLNNLDLISNLRFSDQLIDTLISMKWQGVYKKRTNKGIHITGIKLKNK